MGKSLESSSDIDVEQKELVASWGAKLREVRDSRKMALEDIASELHLDLLLLENIEAECLDNLPSAPFVKGYLRNYARILDVDYEPIIEAYNQVCGEDAPGLALVNQMKETTSGDKAPRYATWAVVAVMAISFMFWWWSEMLPPSVDNEVQLSGATEVPQLQLTIIDNAEVIEMPVEVLSAPEPTEIVDAPVIEEMSSESDAPVSEQTVELATIELQFEGDSWVEITDARGERLFLNIGKTGQNSTVEGVPPIKLLLGNSPAVIMQYNGESFDHRAYEKKGIARFSVGEE
jgi:cytoskeleton protein RodZ